MKGFVELATKKTFWAGIALIVTGVGEGVTTGDWANASRAIFEGLALIFLRHAIQKSK